MLFQEYHRREALGPTTDHAPPTTSMLESWLNGLCKEVETAKYENWAEIITVVLKNCQHPLFVSWNLVRLGE